MLGFKSIIAYALLLSPALANPLPRTILKRTNPSISAGDNFSSQQQTQLTDGFKDAIELAAYALNAIDSGSDIFTKYFNDADRTLVRNVFLAIMGNPSDPMNPDPTGSAKLGGITIRTDFPDDDGDLACDAETMAELREYASANPQLVICPGAFGHGGIGKGYTNVQEIGCGWIGDRVTWKMDTMGSILLHEYTHMTQLVAPPLSKETNDEDDGYGPRGTRALDKSMATNNADSYSWFANEALWSVICQKDYADPQPGDGNDPNCGNAVCQVPKGSP